MYYRLKDNFILRGYDRLPYALINLNNGYADFMNAETMNALELCDRSVDLSLPIIPENIRKFIATAEKHNVVEKCEAGQTINENQKYKSILYVIFVRLIGQ